jgi:hypothetical protein
VQRYSASDLSGEGSATNTRQASFSAAESLSEEEIRLRVIPVDQLTGHFEKIFKRFHYEERFAFLLWFAYQETLVNAIKHGKGLVEVYYHFSRDRVVLIVFNEPKDLHRAMEFFKDMRSPDNLLKTTAGTIMVKKANKPRTFTIGMAD